MNRTLAAAVILAALGVGYLLGNRIALEAVPQASAQEGQNGGIDGRFRIIGTTGSGTFLLDARTGDTWK